MLKKIRLLGYAHPAPFVILIIALGGVADTLLNGTSPWLTVIFCSMFWVAFGHHYLFGALATDYPKVDRIGLRRSVQMYLMACLCGPFAYRLFRDRHK